LRDCMGRLTVDGKQLAGLLMLSVPSVRAGGGSRMC
jgi:hypothetical protein